MLCQLLQCEMGNKDAISDKNCIYATFQDKSPYPMAGHWISYNVTCKPFRLLSSPQYIFVSGVATVCTPAYDSTGQIGQ